MRATLLTALLGLNTLAFASVATAEDLPAQADHLSFSQKAAAQTLRAFDSNGDGTVSQDEYFAAPLARFKSLDTDKNGVLGKGEQKRAQLQAAESLKKAQAAASSGQAERKAVRAAGAEQAVPRPGSNAALRKASDERQLKNLRKSRERGLKALDADKDGNVSSDEFLRGHRAMFKRFDSNGDGVLDLPDLVATQERQLREAAEAAELVKERLAAQNATASRPRISK